ncbi:MAG: cation:proton antiporter [Bacteroidaceae bacterium]|nr:cation:proton antiporter [Bacteroidaceae bacterium]
MFDYKSFFPITDPTWIFFWVLCIILFAPLLFQKLRLPHIIGMILAGLLIGPNGLNILERDDSFELFGKVGLYYIMFLASLEINMQEMKEYKGGALTLGLLAFAVPIGLGMFTNLVVLDFGLVTSVLLASMYASYTLISYPIVARHGLSRLRCVNFVVGGTVITDTLTLFVLAVVGGLFGGEVDGWFFVLLLLKLIALTGVIVFLFPRIARAFFRRYNDGTLQYIFVMALLFLGAGMMELVGMEGILGAFITGLVLNRLIPHSSPLMRRIDFIGNALFIPYFLIGVGMIINVKVLFTGGGALLVMLAMVVTALTGKWLASFITGKAFGMSHDERHLMFGLSSSQAAATLAAALVGHGIILSDGTRLLNDDVLNGTILLILVSCIVSSITTDRASRRILVSGIVQDKPVNTSKKTLLALANPNMVDKLMDLALLLRKENSTIPLSAVTVVLDEDEKMMNRATKVLDSAAHVAASVNVPLLTKLRLTTNLSNGIIHEMKENDYRELIVGFHQKETANDSFLGSVLPELLNGLNCQIIMARLNMPLNTIRRIHITFPAKAEFEAGFNNWVEETVRMAAGLGCKVYYHGHPDTMALIEKYIKVHGRIEAEFYATDGGNDLKRLSKIINHDHLLVIVSARRGSISFRPSLDHVFTQLQRDYQETSVLLIYPNGYSVDSEVN